MPIVAPAPFGWIVFRADTRLPQAIFAQGFAPRINRGGIDVQEGGQMIGGVSTSRDISIATRYAGNYDGYVYVVYAHEGVDVTASLRRLNASRRAIENALSQQELAVATIPARHVIGARRARVNNGVCSISGPVHVNPNYTGADSHQDTGLAYLDTDIEVAAAYPH